MKKKLDLVELEAKIAHMEDFVIELNDTLVKHDQVIMKLIAEIDALSEHALSFKPALLEE
ncbi:MAG: SlyX family protein [Spirochaetia bacterium]|nr:SlyX family protein [Spirochaetia bacterium]